MYKKINKIIVKYLGWILYPTDKLGKENQNLEVRQYYENLGKYN